MAGFGAGPAPEGPIKAQTLPLLSEPEMLERICFSFRVGSLFWMALSDFIGLGLGGLRALIPQVVMKSPAPGVRGPCVPVLLLALLHSHGDILPHHSYGASRLMSTL